MLAKRLAETAQVSTFNARCDWNEYSPVLSIAVDYSSEEQLSFTSTSSDNLKYLERGFYASLEACEKDRNAQELLFQKETRLPILVSYCYVDNASLSYPYNIRIEGLGNSQRQPFYTAVFSDMGVLAPKVQEVVENAKSYFSSQNANLVHYSFRTGQPSHHINFFYYAEKEIFFHNETLYNIPSLDLCKNELELVTSKLGSAGIKLPLTYCGSPFPNSKSVDLYLAWESKYFRLKSSLETYSDYKKCAADRNALVDKYQAAFGPKLLTGVCQRSLSEPEYKVTFFITY